MERRKFTNDDIIMMDDDQRTEALARFKRLCQTKTVEETAERVRGF